MFIGLVAASHKTWINCFHAEHHVSKQVAYWNALNNTYFLSAVLWILWIRIYYAFYIGPTFFAYYIEVKYAYLDVAYVTG